MLLARLAELFQFQFAAGEGVGGAFFDGDAGISGGDQRQMAVDLHVLQVSGFELPEQVEAEDGVIDIEQLGADGEAEDAVEFELQLVEALVIGWL